MISCRNSQSNDMPSLTVLAMMVHFVGYLVQIAYPIMLLDIVHKYQEGYSLCTIRLHFAKSVLKNLSELVVSFYKVFSKFSFFHTNACPPWEKEDTEKFEPQ